MHSNTLHRNVGYPWCNTIQWLAGIIAIKYGCAENSVMNLSAGLVSAAQSRAPLHGLSLCTARVTVSVLSTVTAAVITQIGEEEKKLQYSRSVTAARFVWAEFEQDSLIPGWMWRDLSTEGISPSPYTLLSPSHTSPHPPLDLSCIPTLEEKAGRREVRRSMWSGLPGQNRSVGWVTLRSVDVVVGADTVTRKWAAF